MTITDRKRGFVRHILQNGAWECHSRLYLHVEAALHKLTDNELSDLDILIEQKMAEVSHEARIEQIKLQAAKQATEVPFDPISLGM